MAKFDAFPSLPHDAEGVPVFREAWQEQASALTEMMHARGAFTGAQWAAAFAEECKGGAPFFRAWVRAMERLLDGET